MTIHRILFLAAIAAALARAQTACPVRHLAIFDANVAEFHEERTVQLQPGLNTLEWRSLMPQALLGTLRATADHATVTRQDITLDGADVHGQKAPVLHLVLQNGGAAGAHKIQVDYLAPKLSWKSDYSLLLGPPGSGGSPEELMLDAWISLQNETGADVCSEIVDLIAGDVQLAGGGGSAAREYAANAQAFGRLAADTTAEYSGMAITGVSVFTRLRLGRDISLSANAMTGRFPLFQKLKLPLEQRNIFENEFNTQTLGRGGFMLQPRGLEVRLVSKNNSASPLPAGNVTIYSPEGEFLQVVGQDRIPLTPVGADFSVTQGRSGFLQGTRRIIDRREVPDTSTHGHKLVTHVEVTISNSGTEASTAFVREGVETWGNRDWTVAESSHAQQKLGDHMMEFKLPVPAKGSVKLAYTVEIH